MPEYYEFREKNDRNMNIFPYYLYELYGNPGLLVPIHWHDEIEIMYAKHPGTMLLDGKSISFGENDILLINPGQLHSTYLTYGGHVYHILISSKILDINTDRIVLPEKISDNKEKYIEVLDRLTELRSPVKGSDEYKVLYNIYRLLAYVSEDYRSFHNNDSSVNRVRNSYIRNCTTFIDDNLTSNINIDMIANYVGISKAHLMRLFRSYTGETLNSYIMNRKLEEAKNDIIDGMLISDTAYKYNFSDTAHFCRRFKEKYGCSPGKYNRYTC